jgi:DNA end-binding protein Ku
LPKRKSSPGAKEVEKFAAPVRSLWSGTITFGLVSIPVDLLSAVQPRHTAMKLVDEAGHALGRQYRCSKEDKKLNGDELIRGYETGSGEMIAISDSEFESVAPEMSGDIELRSFVPLEQIPSVYFQKPYFLAPSGKSTKAYHLLAATMERTGRVGIGSFVMRGHEYLVAIVSDNGVLRADTLRYADEIRTPESIGLPKRRKGAARQVNAFVKDIEALRHHAVNLAEFEDKDAAALEALAKSKRKDDDRVIHRSGLEEADGSAASDAKIIDLMAVLRKSLSKGTVVNTADSGPPISLAERRAKRANKAGETKKRTPARSSRRKTARR